VKHLNLGRFLVVSVCVVLYGVCCCVLRLKVAWAVNAMHEGKDTL